MPTPFPLLAHWISVAGPDILLWRRQREPDTSLPVEQDRSPPPPERSLFSGTRPAPPASAEKAAAELAQLTEEARACTACPLHEDRTQAVFADGDATADILFVGEGPGRDEDRQGIPFVGRAGQLLTDIIQKAMGLPRQAVYICNVVKCRPPGNRNPEPDEQKTCGHFLHDQIRLVNPKLIVCLGSIAAHFLIETNLSVTRMRGRLWEYEGIPVVITWHPAYLLRNPRAKGDCWKDIKLALRTLGLPEHPAAWPSA